MTKESSNQSSSSSTRKNRLLYGAFFITLGAIFFAGVAACAKHSGDYVEMETVVFFRNAIALLLIAPWILLNKDKTIKSKKYHLHIVRSLFGLMAMYCYFFALTKLKMADAILFSYSAPIFIPIISAVWLREKILKISLLAILVGFIGMVIVIDPSKEIIDLYSLFGVGAAFFAALAMVTIRNMSSSEPVYRIVFYFSLISTGISSIPFLLSSPSSEIFITLISLVLTGIFAVLGQMCITRGYSEAPSAQVGPFQYSIVIFGAILGWFFWDESLGIYKIIGFTLVCLAGIIAIKAKNVNQKQNSDV